MSASHAEEWNAAIEAGVEWIDLKDPRAGPLGRPELELARQFAAAVGRNSVRHWSIAGGELPDWRLDSDASFCQLLGKSGCIKWALSGCAGRPDWRRKLAACLAALPGTHQAILVQYADHEACDAPGWESVLMTAAEFRMRYILIDTAKKDGGRLLDHLALPQLRQRISHARSLGIEVAVAGSLRLDQLPIGAAAGASWVGVRGAVCQTSDRTSPFCPEKLQHAVAIVRGCARTEGQQETIHVLG